MKRLLIKKPQKIKEKILEYLNSSDELKFSHKLHGILLLLENENNNCSEVSKIYGNTPQTLTAWVHKLNEGEGGDIDVLREKNKPGRNTRLSTNQIQYIKYAIQKTPKQFAINSLHWDGKTLSLFLEQKYNIHLKIRMCQRWLKRLQHENQSI
jgi:transposase